MDRFGRDPGIIGRQIRANDAPRRVVGVMPAGFDFGDLQLFTRFAYNEDFRGARGQVYLQVVGRLAEGATVERARAELARIAEGLSAAWPDTNTPHAPDRRPRRATGWRW